MPLPYTIPDHGLDVCTPQEVMQRPPWLLDERLSTALLRMAQEPDLPFRIMLISGYRSCEHQAQVGTLPCCASSERPCSTHTTCPATGADLWPSVAVTNAVKAHFGRAAVYAGLRWGGGSPHDSDGFPVDWNHVDLGRVE